MPWQIEYLPEEATVVIVSTGETTPQDSVAQTDAAVELQAKYNVHRFLLDYSQTRVTAQLVDIYELPTYYNKRGVPHDLRIAVVFPADHLQYEKYEFYEDVCLNRGYRSLIFDSVDKAWAWLKQDKD